ncbi:TPA: alpha amylase C-terminal domain-containing protein, partial [Mannheimia haemolytica]|nr:alpha amylase C-terminal domain-containing protein [Mannheimia haemolytica]
HNLMTFGMTYQYSEQFVLPLSHDEVVHGKGSLLNKMPGDCWQKFANLRAYYGYMWGYPGKKLLFMGNEFAQGKEWNFAESLDWYLLGEEGGEWHKGVLGWVKALNHLYTQTPALFEQDYNPEGFEWLVVDDHDNSVFAFERKAKNGDSVIVVSNFTPIVRENYRFGVNELAEYQEILNSDLACYCGSNVSNANRFASELIASHGKAYSLSITLPPLSTIFLKRAADKKTKQNKT